MNVIDRAIAMFAPQAGVRRALARQSLSALRSYDGALVGRRTQNWRSTNASANASTKGSLPLLRSRSRDLVRNTWWGERVVRIFTAHAIGTGILPKTSDRRLLAAWNDWGQSCDAEGQLDINGLIALACRCIIESGEVLIRVMPTGQRSDGRVPLEIQLLEPDHLDESRDAFAVKDAAGLVQTITDQGIAYDTRGKRAGYWLFPEHPGARGLVMRRSSIYVPANEILHAYRKDRIGQGRGVPWVAPVVLKGRDLADLEEAVVVKARVEACLAAFIKTSDVGRTLGAAVNETRRDGSARRIETLSPGTVTYLETGEDLQTVSPSSSMQFESVLLSTWMTMAAGAGITYDQMTGDLRQANYSSLRAGKIEFRRLVEQFQWLTLVPMVMTPIWNAFTTWAQTAGVLRSRAAGYPSEGWIMPANEPIDPLKDMQADVIAVRTGRMTWNDFVASWGLDPAQQLDEIETWFKEIDQRGIVLDVDPRRAAPSAKPGSSGAQSQNPDNSGDGNAADPQAADQNASA